MMKMNWKRGKTAGKVVVTLVVDEDDFFRVRVTRLNEAQAISQKLRVLADMAQTVEQNSPMPTQVFPSNMRIDAAGISDAGMTSKKMREYVDNIEGMSDDENELETQKSY